MSGFRARDFQHLSLASGRILFSSCGLRRRSQQSKKRAARCPLSAPTRRAERSWLGLFRAPRASLPLRRLPGGPFVPPQPLSHQWPPGPGLWATGRYYGLPATSYQPRNTKHEIMPMRYALCAMRYALCAMRTRSKKQEARSKKAPRPTPRAPRGPRPRLAPRIRNSPRGPAYLGPLGSATLIHAQLRTAQEAPAPAPAPSPWSPTPPPAPSPQPHGGGTIEARSAKQIQIGRSPTGGRAFGVLFVCFSWPGWPRSASYSEYCVCLLLGLI
jgi:hypothetical protein